MRCNSRPAISSPERTTTTSGSGLALISLTNGGLVSFGKSALTRSTASRSSEIACFTSRSISNSTNKYTAPSRAVALTLSKPANVFNSFSIGLINRRTPSSGEMPSWRTAIIANGTCILGSVSTGKLLRAITPANNTSSIIDSVTRGVLIRRLIKFIVTSAQRVSAPVDH